jgi:glucokinase
MSQPEPVAIGIDLGGTTFAVGALTGQGELVCHHSYLTPETKAPGDVLDALVQAVQTVDQQTGSRAVGLGIGIPGVVDPGSGFVFKCPNLPALDNTPVGPAMENRLPDLQKRQQKWLQAPGRPAPPTKRHVWLHNDAYCATLAELRWGAGRGAQNMVLLTLGTGIGGGVVLDGRPIRGPRGLIGEIGHMTLDPQGPPCGCGNRGCFEALAGRDAIVDYALRRIQSGRPTVLTALVEGDLSKLDPKLIADAARAGDQVALEVMQQVGFYVGLGICNAIVLCDPDLVVVGGGIAAAGEVLFAPLRRTVAARSRISYGKFDPARIVPAALGNLAGIYGAGQLVWEGLG